MIKIKRRGQDIQVSYQCMQVKDIELFDVQKERVSTVNNEFITSIYQQSTISSKVSIQDEKNDNNEEFDIRTS